MFAYHYFTKEGCVGGNLVQTSLRGFLVLPSQVVMGERQIQKLTHKYFSFLPYYLIHSDNIHIYFYREFPFLEST